jgi:tetratricopeptide (TPR) repeat protein
VDERQLAYWERLKLLRPRARWGERFYSFNDLVVARRMHELACARVPARRVHRALQACEEITGRLNGPLSALRLERAGREIVVLLPPALSAPIEPLTGQYLLPFGRDTDAAARVHTLRGRTAQEWFEAGLALDEQRETLSQAVDAYRRATELAPQWVVAHINLGTALYQISDLDAALEAFETALALEATNPTIHFNLGCVLDDLERTREAIPHFRQAISIAPRHADAHFNLAMALEKIGQMRRAAEHWQEYLRLEPRGAWAEFARARLRRPLNAGPPLSFPGRAPEQSGEK